MCVFNTFQLKILSEFQTRVDHAANTKGDGADAQIEAAIVGDRLLDDGILLVVFCSSRTVKCGNLR